MNAIRAVAALLLFGIATCAADGPPAAKPDLHQRSQQAEALLKKGNYKEALDIYKELLARPDHGDAYGIKDIQLARDCLRRLNRVNELDALLETAADVHAKNWRMLQAVANAYASAQHYGYMIGGEFRRGRHRGGGQYINTQPRDRARAMQLLAAAREQAVGHAANDNRGVAGLFVDFADFLRQGRGQQEAWRLQYLTDLSVLPDYEDGAHYSRGVGTPVDADGKPITYSIPASWEAAANDGERWRWLLMQAMEIDDSRTGAVLTQLAGFMHQQFGVQTLADRLSLFQSRGADSDDGKVHTSGTYDLHTLSEDETITRLASGIRRHTLPSELNYIKIYRRIASDPACKGHAESALQSLAQIFENRRQYVAAADCWLQTIKRFGPGSKAWKQDRLNQIVGSWCRFDGASTHLAGSPATLGFVFRNAKKVEFTAKRIDTEALLADIKVYLKSNPKRLDWQKIRLGDIGYRLIHQDEKQYVGKTVAEWDLALEPRSKHWDRRIDVVTPLKQSGAYLLTATAHDGNTCHIVVWINDTVIVKKALDNGTLYYVADAVTGKPIPKLNVEFFGYHSDYRDRRYQLETTQFAEFTDTDGQIIPAREDLKHGYNWLITATDEASGRLAYMGFSSAWYQQHHDQEYRATKSFVLTDRPVYRPAQKVYLKCWVRHAQYDQDDTSQFAGKSIEVIVNDPKGTELWRETLVADDYGGVNSALALAEDAMLGVYRVQIFDLKHVDPRSGKVLGRRHVGHGSFRVEEYKKPEFEVTIDAPTDPVMLGETIEATIKAKYYFGAPVTQAKVKYKVLRYSHTAQWFPPMPWDWFYGPGYWWFAYDYGWYPGWHQWGCRRPWPWWQHRGHTPPEVVSDSEVEIGEDGVVKVTIDTEIAKVLHGDIDHRYEITAEVVDASRRTIVGKGSVLVARKPFKVYAWPDRGHYRVGDVIQFRASARTLDSKPVAGPGKLSLYRVSYGDDNAPIETLVQSWDVPSDVEGNAQQQLKASQSGQYRLSYHVTDSKGHTIEGAYVLTVRGEGDDTRQFRFNHLELVNDKPDYQPGDTVQLMVNTDRKDATVLFFARPANGICLPPDVLRMAGKSTVRRIDVTRKDMPNFFVEALTVSDGRVYTEVREIIVPPEKRVLNVEVLPDATRYRPGGKAAVKLKLTDFLGKPFVGSTVVSVYDKALEYVSGGSNVGDIKSFFWKWRRRHQSRTEDNVSVRFNALSARGAKSMGALGVFGHSLADDAASAGVPGALRERKSMARASAFAGRAGAAPMMLSASADSMVVTEAAFASVSGMAVESGAVADGGGAEATVTIRKEFADLAFWAASVETDTNGLADIEIDMPENLTTWMIKTWGMGHGTRVGEGTAEVITSKDLIVRLQAPRFFVEKDEVVLSAIVHNYLDATKQVQVVLDLEGDTLEPMVGARSQEVRVDANGEQRVNWRVKVLREGDAVITMKALTDEESDAMQSTFPVYVHGMLKTESWSRALRPEQDSVSLKLSVPAERRPEQTRLEIRYSPTIAMAMVDAMPYLAEYPYRNSESLVSRLVSAALTQKAMQRLGVDLAELQQKMTNLNPQEIGDAQERAKQWERRRSNPVFTNDGLERVVKDALKDVTAWQNSDGGWGWFSHTSSRSWPHNTAYVVHGLQIALENDVAVVPAVLKNGVAWLERHQAQEIHRLQNAAKKVDPWKSHADNMDALIYMVLGDAGQENVDMREFLYRDRNHLSVYAKAMFGLAMHKQGQTEKRDMLMRNVGQFVETDDENQTAWLRLGNDGYWWYWYGSEFEAHAYYLKLLAAVTPEDPVASGIVKYLVNNRKHATYWQSTRDTAICLESIADFIKATSEDRPDMTVDILVDGKVRKTVAINADNLFSFDSLLVLEGDAVATGEHIVSVRRKGRGPLYLNAYLTNFTLEDFISRTGLEIKVDRAYYKLEKVDKSIKVVGSHGQSLDQKVEKYNRVLLKHGDHLKSGDLVEIELLMESKNDYEYIMFDDMKAAGFEPVDVRSGQSYNALNAYMELRDERVAFFVRRLARGQHSLSYRMRAEVPGTFSALPTRANGVYAPELRANSDEIRLTIEE